jgi:glycosyltransferase involved in cell wall biosynthesis
MKVAITASSGYVQVGDEIYVAGDTDTSLSQWLGLLRGAHLVLPRLNRSEPPPGWVAMPGVSVEPLCERPLPWRQRREQVLENARRTLRDADLLYARGPGYEVYWTCQAAVELGVPILLELHGEWAPSVLAESAGGIARVFSRNWRAASVERATRWMVQHCRALVTIGPELALRYARPGLPTLVSTNHTLDIDRYRPRMRYVPARPPRLLFVGALEARKGVADLLRAQAILRDNGRETQLHLIGSGSLRGRLAELAEKLDLTQNVFFHGQMPHGEQIFSQYELADAFVLPARAGEGVPRAIHESMALGCPVVATDVGSVWWQLDSGRAGLVVQPGQPLELAMAISQLTENESERARISQAGFERALQFSLDRQIERIRRFLVENLPHEMLSHAALAGGMPAETVAISDSRRQDGREAA